MFNTLPHYDTMKLIQIPDSDTYIMASSIKSVSLYNPSNNDYGIDITSVDGTTKNYWLRTGDREIALEILTKFIFDFNNL